MTCANSFTHCKHKIRPIAEVHLGFWVLIRHAVRISAFISLAARSCLGFSLFQVFGHPQGVRVRDLETAQAANLRSAASGRLSAPGFFPRLPTTCAASTWSPRCIRRIADPSAF